MMGKARNQTYYFGAHVEHLPFAQKKNARNMCRNMCRNKRAKPETNNQWYECNSVMCNSICGFYA